MQPSRRPDRDPVPPEPAAAWLVLVSAHPTVGVRGFDGDGRFQLDAARAIHFLGRSRSCDISLSFPDPAIGPIGGHRGFSFQLWQGRWHVSHGGHITAFTHNGTRHMDGSVALGHGDRLEFLTVHDHLALVLRFEQP